MLPEFILTRDSQGRERSGSGRGAYIELVSHKTTGPEITLQLYFIKENCQGLMTVHIALEKRRKLHWHVGPSIIWKISICIQELVVRRRLPLELKLIGCCPSNRSLIQKNRLSLTWSPKNLMVIRTNIQPMPTARQFVFLIHNN